MSNLTPELNLAQAVGDDDTADYLTLPAGLAGSLAILDGLFNASTGHNHNGAHQGSTLGPNAFADNSIPGAKLVDLSVTGGKIAAGTITGDKLAQPLWESLFAGATVQTSTNYTVAANVMYVFCFAAVTVTLPSAATTNRPITVVACTGNTTINATSGSVLGGSVDTASGTVINGRANAGDSITYKSETTTNNWRAV